MMKQVAIVLLALAVVAYAGTVQRTVIAEKNPYVTEDWIVGPPAAADEILEFKVFLKQRNLDVLNMEFERRTNPKSPLWRHWLSTDEITAIVAPERQVVRKVKAWLKFGGATFIKDNGDSLHVTAPISAANKIFATVFHEFTYKHSGHVVFRHLASASVPNFVLEKVDFITGITAFPYVGRKFAYLRNQLGLDELDGKVVPYTIDQLYKVDYTLKDDLNPAATVCPVEFQGDNAWDPDDYSYFQDQNLLPNVAVPRHNIIGPYNYARPDGEATLDMQYAAGVANNATTWYWTTDGWMLEWADDFYNTQVVPTSVSMSWGWTEDNQCEITLCTSSESYVSKCNTEFQKIGLRGVSLFASSGDQGAPGDGDDRCQNSREPLSSIYPGASPYVTSIGATMMLSPSQVGGEIPQRDQSINDQPVPPVCDDYTCVDITSTVEVACMYPEALITTGGGFSVYSNRAQLAPWQDSVVTTYLNTAVGLPPSSDYNANNRGFPDVSALGHNYLIYISGKWEDVDGTSCSAPVWAGINALLNSYELNNGRNLTGFISPLLYQAYDDQPSIFYDIIDGNNTCTESSCCKYGYPTAVGWDAVTGLGTPDFSALLTYLTGLA